MERRGCLRIDAVLVGPVAPLAGTNVSSGIVKRSTGVPVWLSPLGFAGDAQGDKRFHGGLEKAVHHYPREHYRLWNQSGYGEHLLLEPGAFGENISTTGWSEADVCVGDVVQMGDAVVQVTQGRQPCWRLDARFCHDGMAREMQQNGRTGWYYKVLVAGRVHAGQSLTLLYRPHPAWTIARLAHLVDSTDLDNVHHWLEASKLDVLATRWRETFKARAERRAIEDWGRRLQRPAAG
ncbi:MAG: MOSC domain-containing protein [Polaromonas sp.]|nr:MOSC domain-containing protein [Polaromonas sp.]